MKWLPCSPCFSRCGKILGHELVDVEAKDREGKTALHIAAERGYVMMCQRIIAQPRINLQEVDHQGRTALAYAMDGGHVRVVELLVGREDCDISQLFDCHCGDGLCQTGYGENCSNCGDCRDPNWTCGDGICDCLEFESGSCPDDCD